MDKFIENEINNATEKFRELLVEQYERSQNIHERNFGMRNDGSKYTIGLADGDGIGPVIMSEAKAVLNKLLQNEISDGKIELKEITGFTLENRLATGKTVPEDVLKQIESCSVILKGPTTTPNVSMDGKNIESANVYLRKKLDLYANVRPVKVPSEGIDWTFFRENTEGEYALGSEGVSIGNDLSIDFKVTTREGTKRIAREAFEYAVKNDKSRVSIVTKSNIMKKTDGDFQSICLEVARDYPEIQTDCWYVDIMAANLVNKSIRNKFEVMILPNLYGDIITDEAAQIQGGVGTAGSANIGSDYAIFEAIHGSAPRMVEDGIAHLANPASLLTAAVIMLRHIGLGDKATKLEDAVRIANSMIGSRMTGLPGGQTCEDFAKIVKENL